MSMSLPVIPSQPRRQRKRTKSLFLKHAVLLGSLLCSVGCIASAPFQDSLLQDLRDKDLQSRRKTLQTYFSLEEEQKYADIYDLLSQRLRNDLKNFDVSSPEEYRALRLKSEARWFDFRILSKHEVNSTTVRFKVRATVEESGEREEVVSTYYLIESNGTWKLDRWEY